GTLAHEGVRTMITSFGPIALAAVIAAIFGILPLVGVPRARPGKPDRVKNAPYECGVVTIGPTQIQFKSKFYIYALIFVLFDVEAAFLFPWAVTYSSLGIYALIEVLIFVGL